MSRRPDREHALYLASAWYGARVVRMALSRGELVRPLTCEACGVRPKLRRSFKTGTRPGVVYAHHDDYNEPLCVRWLCAACHRRWHAKNSAVALRELSVLTDGEAFWYAVYCGDACLVPLKSKEAA